MVDILHNEVYEERELQVKSDGNTRCYMSCMGPESVTKTLFAKEPDRFIMATKLDATSTRMVGSYWLRLKQIGVKPERLVAAVG